MPCHCERCLRSKLVEAEVEFLAALPYRTVRRELPGPSLPLDKTKARRALRWYEGEALFRCQPAGPVLSERLCLRQRGARIGLGLCHCPHGARLGLGRARGAVLGVLGVVRHTTSISVTLGKRAERPPIISSHLSGRRLRIGPAACSTARSATTCVASRRVAVTYGVAHLALRTPFTCKNTTRVARACVCDFFETAYTFSSPSAAWSCARI